MSDLTTIHLKKGPYEASALTPCHNPTVLHRHGFDRAFWLVLDEGRVEHSIGLLGHREGAKLAKKWKLKVLDARPLQDIKTDDAECLAAHDGWLYVLGSHFGKKAGPLQARRQFVARFQESALDSKVHKAKCPLDIARRPFLLHRAINDGLRRSDLDLIPLGPHAREAYLENTLRQAFDKDRDWGPLVDVEDWPINIEGLSFVGEHALVGLRFPVTRNGEPILIRIDGLLHLFEDDGEPPIADRAWALKDVGSRAYSAGVRGLEQVGEDLHVLTGPIGTARKDSALVKDYPGSKQVKCKHWRLPLAALDETSPTTPQLVREFERRDYVEGIARSEQAWFYVSDLDDSFALHVCTDA